MARAWRTANTGAGCARSLLFGAPRFAPEEHALSEKEGWLFYIERYRLPAALEARMRRAASTTLVLKKCGT